MYNDKSRQYGGNMRRDAFGRMSGASRPSFAMSNNASDLPDSGSSKGGRLCDGTLPQQKNEQSSCAEKAGGWGLVAHPLAMVYSPLQEFHEIYTPDVALSRGTMFSELDLPFEGGNGKKGGFCL